MFSDCPREVSLVHPEIDDVAAVLETGLNEGMAFNTIERH